MKLIKASIVSAIISLISMHIGFYLIGFLCMLFTLGAFNVGLLFVIRKIFGLATI